MFTTGLYFLQVYTGSYRPQSSAVVSVSDVATLKVGHLVAVQCENCSLEPLLGKVLEIFTDVGEIEIVWLEGAYNKAWKVWKHRDPKNRRRIIDWTDRIPLSSVLLFDFELTKNNLLRKSTIEHL